MNTPSLEDTKQKEEVAVLAQQASDVVAKPDPNLYKLDAAAQTEKEDASSY
jgi:hypothetical protein